MVGSRITSASMRRGINFKIDRLEQAKHLMLDCIKSGIQIKNKVDSAVFLFAYCSIEPEELINTKAYGVLRNFLKCFREKSDYRAKHLYEIWRPGCKKYMKKNNVDYYGIPYGSDHKIEHAKCSRELLGYSRRRF